VLTWVLLVVVARIEVWGALALAPYALWLSVATALSVAYARLN
jgi:benzodiazapine receptor